MIIKKTIDFTKEERSVLAQAYNILLDAVNMIQTNNIDSDIDADESLFEEINYSRRALSDLLTELGELD